MGAADGVDRREIEHVEAHVANRRQALVHIAQGAMAVRVVRLGAGKQFVPTGELRQRPLDLQRVDGARTAMLTWVGGGHRCRGFMGQQYRDPLVVQVGAVEPMQQVIQHRPGFTLRALHGAFDQQAALRQLQPHWNAGGVLLGKLVSVAFVDVPPGLDTEFVCGDLGGGELALPDVPSMIHPLQRRAPPAFVTLLPPAHGRGELIVTIGEYPAADDNRLPDDRLGREAPLLQHGLRRLDGDTRHSQRLFKFGVSRGVGLGIGHRGAPEARGMAERRYPSVSRLVLRAG